MRIYPTISDGTQKPQMAGRRARTPRSPRVVEARATLSARPDGSIRIVAVADTHSKPHPDAAKYIAALEPDAILHGGDIGDLSVLDSLRTIAPVVAVRGNIDAHAPDLPDVITVDIKADSKPILRLLLTHIAVYGPKIRADVARLANERGASLIVCGHSHVPFIGRDRGLLVLNAGSIGPRRFLLPIVFGTIDLSRAGLQLRHHSCETGAPWEPPGDTP